MGVVTPNISIYIPAAGETNYDSSFAAGMINIDQHDHSGPPNKGVPIASSGISDGAVTYNKLNANVADNTTGIGTSGVLLNQLVILGLLKNIYQIVTSTGFIAKNGSLATARTLTSSNTNRITITNGDGASGNPLFNLPDIPQLLGVNGQAGTFSLQAGGVTQANVLSALLDLSPNNIAIHNGSFMTGGLAPSATTNVTGFTVANGETYLALTSIFSGGTGNSNISIMALGTSANDSSQNVFSSPNPTLALSGNQVQITNNQVGSLDFTVSWLRLS